MKFNAYNSILWSYYICGLTLIIYIFAPLDLGEANIFNKIFWSIPGLVNIFTIECFIDVLIAILPGFNINLNYYCVNSISTLTINYLF